MTLHYAVIHVPVTYEITLSMSIKCTFQNYYTRNQKLSTDTQKRQKGVLKEGKEKWRKDGRN